jgi:cytoskeletal protein RodZ
MVRKQSLVMLPLCLNKKRGEKKFWIMYSILPMIVIVIGLLDFYKIRLFGKVMESRK